MALYKEHFTKTGTGWIPDALEPVTHLPHFGAMPDPAAKIPGQTTRVYLLGPVDSAGWQAARFPAGGAVEGRGLVVWPMEIRVLPVNVPLTSGEARRAVPALEQSADTAAREAMEDWLKGVRGSRELDLDSVRAVIRRNALQDTALAKDRDRAEVGSFWSAREPLERSGIYGCGTGSIARRGSLRVGRISPAVGLHKLVHQLVHGIEHGFG